jgi:glutathione peroxidase
MFAKVDVNGDGASEFYKWLKSEQPGDAATSDITWNFEKFLIDRTGNVVARFSPMTTPEDIAAHVAPLL